MLWLFLIHNWLFWADEIKMDRWMVEVLSAPLWNQSCGIRWDLSSVQLVSHVQLFVTPWTTACQASLSITNFQSPPKLISIESLMPSNHLSSVAPFCSCPQSFLASESFQMSQLFTSGGQSIGVSASTSVLPMNTQDWSLGWTGWISLQSRDSEESSPTSQFKSINSSELSFLHSPTLTSIRDHWKNHSLD